MGVEKQTLAEELQIPGKLLAEGAKQAHALLEGGFLDKAIEMAEGLVAADERNPYYRHVLGTAFYRKREYRSALSVAEEGLKLTPGNQELVELRDFAAKALGKR
jgi:hypothetical protein